jgi:hypothetical protein
VPRVWLPSPRRALLAAPRPLEASFSPQRPRGSPLRAFLPVRDRGPLTEPPDSSPALASQTRRLDSRAPEVSSRGPSRTPFNPGWLVQGGALALSGFPTFQALPPAHPRKSFLLAPPIPSRLLGPRAVSSSSPPRPQGLQERAGLALSPRRERRPAWPFRLVFEPLLSNPGRGGLFFRLRDPAPSQAPSSPLCASLLGSPFGARPRNQPHTRFSSIRDRSPSVS